MSIKFNRRTEGSIEIVIGGRAFPIAGVPPKAEIPKDLLFDLRLSDLPEEVAIRPLGVKFPSGSRQQVSCSIYGFRDGSAWALVEVVEPGERDWPPVSLTALQEAVREQKAQEEDIDTDTDIFQDSAGWKFGYVIELFEDLPTEEALRRLETTARKLAIRSEEIVGGKNFRAFGSQRQKDEV